MHSTKQPVPIFPNPEPALDAEHGRYSHQRGLHDFPERIWSAGGILYARADTRLPHGIGATIVHNFFNAVGRARTLIWVWALAAWACSTAILVIEPDNSLLGSAIHPNSCSAAVIGLFMSAILSPLLTASWMRWYWGALLGNLIGVLMMWVFFFLNPTEWHPERLDAWKSVAIFVSVGMYPMIVFPISSAAGALSARLIRHSTDKTG